MSVAFWCVLVAALLPYVPVGLASRLLDPKMPRKGVPNLQGVASRAYGAHLNAFEAFPPFAAAVIISHLTLGANAVTNVLAILFIVVRAAHCYFYINDMPPLRSGAFFVGAIIIVALF